MFFNTPPDLKSMRLAKVKFSKNVNKKYEDKSWFYDDKNLIILHVIQQKWCRLLGFNLLRFKNSRNWISPAVNHAVRFENPGAPYHARCYLLHSEFLCFHFPKCPYPYWVHLRKVAELLTLFCSCYNPYHDKFHDLKNLFESFHDFKNFQFLLRVREMETSFNIQLSGRSD